MGKPQNSPPSSSDHHQWQRIFKTLANMLQSQQSQIETLATKCKFLENYIHIQHDHWFSRAQFFESHIAQLKKEEAKSRKMHQSKLDLMVQLKERMTSVYKKQYELAEAGLEDFHAFVEALTAEVLELKAKEKAVEFGKGGMPVENSEEKQHIATLKQEIRMLKHSNKSEEAALLAEKDFAWHQVKKVESYYTDMLRNKKIEVEHANEAVEKLQHNLLELHALVNEKDDMIAKLKAGHELDRRRHAQEVQEANEKIERLQHAQEVQEANEKIERLQLDKEELCSLAKNKDETIDKLKNEIAKLEMNVRNCTVEKSRFCKEHSENDSITPTESNLRRGSRKRKPESAKQSTNQNHGRVSDDTSGSRASASVRGLVRCSSKRKPISDSPADMPALFHSDFKVPRLKKVYL